MPRRIFISSTVDEHLSPPAYSLKRQIARRIDSARYAYEMFDPWHSECELSQGRAWTLSAVNDVVSRCVGAVIIGLPRWVLVSELEVRMARWSHLTLGTGMRPEQPTTDTREYRFASEYCHYEAAVAFSHGLPMLVLADESIERRGIFSDSIGMYIVRFPKNADEQWVESNAFGQPFERWLQRVQDRRDVFLGYCSQSASVAREIRDYLEGALGVAVLDWQRDFAPGGTIMGQITEAAQRSTAGLFLFTRDDPLTGSTDEAAPRDNVVFETGFFSHAKGPARVLVIREVGSKMPADLGGEVYVEFDHRAGVAAGFDAIGRFIEEAL